MPEMTFNGRIAFDLWLQWLTESICFIADFTSGSISEFESGNWHPFGELPLLYPPPRRLFPFSFKSTMPASPCEIPPINVHLPGANAVISEIPVKLTASPSSLAVDDEQLTRTVHYTHDGKSITFEIVNKRISLMEPDSSIEEADATPDNIFKRISRTLLCSCVFLKTRHVKAKSLRTIGAA